MNFINRYIKSILILGLISVILCISIEAFGGGAREYGSLRDAFRETNFEYTGSSIEINGAIEDGKVAQSSLNSYIHKLIQIYGQEEDWEISNSSESRHNVGIDSIYAKLDSEEFEFNIAIINSINIDIKDTYFNVSITLKQEDTSIEYVEQVLNNIYGIFKAWNVDIRTCITLQGALSGRLEKSQISYYADEIFEVLDAKNKQVYVEDYIYSVYGYSEKLSRYYIDPINNQKLNLNIVFRYEDINNTTVLYIVTPIMDKSY